jgi:hypothetical protein
VSRSSMKCSALQEGHGMVNELSVCRKGVDIEFSGGRDCKANGVVRTVRTVGPA